MHVDPVLYALHLTVRVCINATMDSHTPLQEFRITSHYFQQVLSTTWRWQYTQLLPQPDQQA
eukprot:11091417-Ditylum_brightwellii.AAC.1